MIVTAKTRGFICTTAHPVGCDQNVQNQIDFVKQKGEFDGAKKVLVIGASAGYGLSSRITSAFANGADTIGVIFDKPASGNRTASAGWYNTASFEKKAHAQGLYAKTVNGDAFSTEIKQQTIDLIKKDLGKVDMVIYSLASPRRTATDGTVYNSVLKCIGQDYTNKTINLKTNSIDTIEIASATQEEIDHTIKVMGGEDWKDWIDALKKADAITDNATTIAYSYIGPEVTHPMYKDGTIGRAKDHLYQTSKEITTEYGVKGYIAVNKALVTQASSAIPIVPLYIAILYKLMKEKNVHEGCIGQIQRLYQDKLFCENIVVDDMGRFRPDDLEMQDDIQKDIQEIWSKLNDDDVEKYADLKGYWKDFYNIFGFDVDGVDYQQDVEIVVDIPSIEN